MLPSDLWVLATAAMLGFMHALELDHMLAVTTFVSRRPALRTAASFGARWGIGHSIAVLLAGGALLATGIRWPERYDALGEALVGVMLLGLGVWAIASARRLHFHADAHHARHGHAHAHADGAVVHAHAHDHAHETQGPHDHGITLVGLLHGLAGTSAVVALVPVTLMRGVGLGLGYLTAFGVGVTAGMTVFAVVAAIAVRHATQQSFVWGRRVTMLIGAAGIGVGVWWIAQALREIA